MIATATRFGDPWTAIAIGGMTSVVVSATSAGDFLKDKSFKWQGRAGFCIDRGTYRPPAVNVDGLFGAVRASPTVDIGCGEEAPIIDSAVVRARDEILRELRTLRMRFVAPPTKDTVVAAPAALDDAIVVTQAWPNDVPVPCLEVDNDSQVSLEVMTEDGLAVAAIDFLGKDHIAAYSIVNNDTIISAGKLNTSSTTALIKFFQKLNIAIS